MRLNRPDGLNSFSGILPSAEALGCHQLFRKLGSVLIGFSDPRPSV
jgi:hypothetical protein